MPDFTPVKSSNIESVAHDGENLHIRFKGANDKPGQTYTYQGVSPVLHQKLMAADSPGGFLASNIRGKYPHTKPDQK